MDNIKDLVVKQAKREGISDKDVAKDAVLAEIKDTHPQEGRRREVLSKKCLKDLMGAIDSTERLFHDMVKKIEAASDALLRPQILSRGGQQSAPEPTGRNNKVKLDEIEKELLFLTEEKIGVMEVDVEARKAELNINLAVFEWAM